MLKRCLFYSAALTSLAVAAVAGIVVWLVVYSPGQAIRQGSIKDILAVESPVYYSDGQSRIGVFFEKTHRQYVAYEQLPKRFVDAILAAEDHDFFNHFGIDIPGMFRAMAANLRAGRIVQGGSTITQQAAKNLFKRKSRSVQAKLKELIYALRLEYHYPKKKILEFYVNQFYVSGNGRGLGVASRYYFDKPVAALDLVECAFIAGSVKSPNTYNPFIKRDDAAMAKARLLAKRRTGYVLAQMYALKMIDAAQYQAAIRREIPFRQGKMSYSLNTVMDLVKDALDTPEVEEALWEHGIDNIATSGIRIVTTVERDLQEQGLRDMQQELSRLDVRMRGFDRNVVQHEYKLLPGNRGASVIEKGALLFGKVVGIEAAAPVVTVSFGVGSELVGRIDREGLMPLAESLARYEQQRWSQAGDKELRHMLAQLAVGDRVFVQVREIDPIANVCLLELAKYPKLQGAMLIMKEGSIRAMAGGFENHYYNRAVSAKRSMGSVIKPLVYCAALQLGWNSADALDNRRAVFSYQRQAYFPRPDHQSPYERVSMSWAGVHSENVATVWLLYHLCDRLSPAQFKELTEHLGLAMSEGETSQEYKRRIRDGLGVVIDQNVLRRAAYARAVRRLGPDLLFAGRTAEYEALQDLPYGQDFNDFMTRVAREAVGAANRKELDEFALRREILKRNALRYFALRDNLAAVRRVMETGEAEAAPAGDRARLREGALYHNRAEDRYRYGGAPASGEWQPVGDGSLRDRLAGMDEAGRQQFWRQVSIEGRLSVATLDQLRALIEKEYAALAALPAYEPEVLHQVHDFRVLAGLRYMIALSRELGIESKLDPVLSFPLGSNVISLLEASRVYEAMAGGDTFRNEVGELGDAIAIIDRVENSDGEVIFAPQRLRRRAVAPPVAVAVADIMRNVVRFGTGNYAATNLLLHSRDPIKEEQLSELHLVWPVIGKTGTANRYTNAAFAGVVPAGGGAKNCASLQGGYVVTAYVGFDDNAPMQRTTTHITGSTGALPLWTELAKSIVLERDYAGNMDVVDFYFASKPVVPLRYESVGQIEVPVDAERGGGVAAGNAGVPATVVTFGTLTADGLTPTRFFLPFWRSGEGGL